MCFCTIVTADYFGYVLALKESLKNFRQDVKLYVLVTKGFVELKTDNEITIIYPEALCSEGIGKDIFDKYYNSFMDGFRWSMKPVLLKYLLTDENHEKAVYLDCDIHFYSDYNFLIDELNTSGVLLTPHWRSHEPVLDHWNFMQLYVFGLFNGGFIGVSKRGIPAMEWWAKANYFICVVDACKGQYVDQTHLNLMPIYFEGVKSLLHKGCNIADWNMIECKRTLVNNEVLINDIFPVVFIHYSQSTLIAILTGKDPLLEGHLTTYFKRLKTYGIDLQSKVLATLEAKQSPGHLETLFLKPRIIIKNILRKISEAL